MEKTLKHTITLSLVIFFSCLVGAGQTSDELKQRYGSPDDSGRYLVRQGVVLYVTNAKDQRKSEIIIESGDLYVSNSSNIDRDRSSKVMPSEVAQSVLDEILPTERRGKEGIAGAIESGCTILPLLDYEFVTISMSKRCSEQGGGTYRITIRWKNSKDL